MPGRTNIVVSRNRDFAAPGVVVAPGIEAALAVARGDALRRGADAIAVIGGADLYAHTIACADRLVITHVHLRPDGDTMFPAIDPGALARGGAQRARAPDRMTQPASRSLFTSGAPPIWDATMHRVSAVAEGLALTVRVPGARTRVVTNGRLPYKPPQIRAKTPAIPT